ncbi:LuxR C-terminal-related transcriptional regulator [Moheibacter sp.]|uniref:LuxR C-terminal-related transcriptional regulator n=1 Tax=Moheibacter sp. TaxID=1965316 RepID=UPI003C767B89
MEKIEKLVEIWKNIPAIDTQPIDLSQKEIIQQYMDIFHVGDCFYLIFNTQTAEMEYVDPKIISILGYNPEEFNLQLVMDSVHEEDIPYYFHYEKSAIRFFTNLDPSVILKYKFSYDYRIKTKDGEYKRVLQQVVPIYYFPEGGARTIGIFTDISHLNVQGIPKLSFIGMKGEPSYYNMHLQEEFRMTKNLFTNRENQILNEVLKGVSSKEISEKLHISLLTVQTHRKNILKKSGCASLTELLTKSVREGWV